MADKRKTSSCVGVVGIEGIRLFARVVSLLWMYIAWRFYGTTSGKVYYVLGSRTVEDCVARMTFNTSYGENGGGFWFWEVFYTDCCSCSISTAMRVKPSAKRTPSPTLC